MSEISVHVKDKHACGHMHEMIWHMKEADIKGLMDMHYPKLEPIDRSNASFSPHADIGTEHTFELSGNVGKMEARLCACCGLKPKGLWRRFLDWILRSKNGS